MNKLDLPTPHQKQPLRYRTHEYLLLGAGPVNCSERVLRAMSFQIQNPLTNLEIMDEVKEMCKYLLQTKNEYTLLGQTSGNGGNETIVCNLVDPGETILVAIGGTWGEKVAQMAERRKAKVVTLSKPPGEIYTIEELEDVIKKNKARVLFLTHGESTGGTLQKLEGFGTMCHKYDCLLVVDAVVSIAVEPFFMDRWEIDAVCCGTQKAIGAPPGLSILSFSNRAVARMQEKKTPPPYYMDLQQMATYWNCTSAPRIYHYTFCSSLLNATREALAEICEEGLPKIWARHKAMAEKFWKHLDELGLKCFVENKENRFHGVICTSFPEGTDYMKIWKYIRDNFQIELSPGYGPTTNKALRIGFLGPNCHEEIVDSCVNALKAALEHISK